MKNQSPCHKCDCTEDRMICSEKCQMLVEYRKTIKSDGGNWQPTSSIVPGTNLGSKRIEPISRRIVEEDDY